MMMKRLGKRLFTTGLGLGVAATPVHAIDREYDGPSPGAWHVTSNWEPDGIPDENDHVIIPTGKICEIREYFQEQGKAQSVELQGTAELFITANRKLIIHGSRTDIANSVASEVLAIDVQATLTMQDETQLMFKASGALKLRGTLEIDCGGFCSGKDDPTIWLRSNVQGVAVMVTTTGGGVIKSLTGSRCRIIGNTDADVFSLGTDNNMWGSFDIPITFVSSGTVHTSVFDNNATKGNVITLRCNPKVLRGNWFVDGGLVDNGNEAKIVVNAPTAGTASFTVKKYGRLEINHHFIMAQDGVQEGVFTLQQPQGKLIVKGQTLFEVSRFNQFCGAPVQ